IREWHEVDLPEVLGLLDAAMGWVPDEVHESFFRWKHLESPFGSSPAWVMTDGDRIVGFRIFMRWEFDRHGSVARAVRAVDTATHPEYQGRGIFSRLTLHALEDLRAEGVAFVFNTPNDSSRPGYLKMGWEMVGRPPVLVRPRHLLGFPRLLGARTPAEKWSLGDAGGEPASAVLADDAAIGRLLASVPTPDRVRTCRSPAFLAWRYGFGPLHYRAVIAGSTVEDGLALFRVRRRGSLREAAVCDVLVPGGDRRVQRRLLKRVTVESGADYAIRLGGRPTGFVPLPRQGPTLVWRAVSDPAAIPLAEWDLTLGDIELF
ncbi:MAG: GNAT family N-acetyltransferase, partial [Nocardioidaceae bacterium]